MTLAFKDSNSILPDVISVADDDAEKRVDDILFEILKRKFGKDFEPEFLSRCCDMSLKYLLGLGDILPGATSISDGIFLMRALSPWIRCAFGDGSSNSTRNNTCNRNHLKYFFWVFY